MSALGIYYLPFSVGELYTFLGVGSVLLVLFSISFRRAPKPQDK